MNNEENKTNRNSDEIICTFHFVSGKSLSVSFSKEKFAQVISSLELLWDTASITERDSGIDFSLVTHYRDFGINFSLVTHYEVKYNE